ncbi:MAG: gliding motility protein GldN, partial [Bacteroidota bacterium]|nr:gliding motility protein GldN [Bacteroidota bacterium]
MKKIFFALFFAAGTLCVNAQAPNLSNDTKPKPVEKPVDGYYKNTNILSARVSPYANLRESDVMFSKRVW